MFTEFLRRAGTHAILCGYKCEQGDVGFAIMDLRVLWERGTDQMMAQSECVITNWGSALAGRNMVLIGGPEKDP